MDSTEKTAAALEPSGRAVRAVRVDVLEGPDAGSSFAGRPGASVSVGSAEDNDLRLTDAHASRYHLDLTPTAAGIRVEDLGSRNGTFVGDLRVERAVARPGARLRVGGSALEIHDDFGAPRTIDAAVEIDGFVATSAPMRALVDDARRIAASEASVLLLGETGTGKEVLASAIHDMSPRAAGPFVVVDCGSLPATLVASELFGHERGAFTGAERQRQGAFELAHGGTLFLDEIGELPMEVQPMLLGALERRRFRRVGGDQSIDVDIRVIAATHRDLRAQVNADQFRGDLYYRLAVARLVIPPLRHRPEDIGPLVQHFAQTIGGGTDMAFGPAAIEALARHRWTGNVRELRNVVEAALAMGQLRLESTLPRAAADDVSYTGDEALPLYKDARAAALDRFELRYLSELMRRADGNASAAARLAHMARPYLLRLLKRHDLR